MRYWGVIMDKEITSILKRFSEYYSTVQFSIPEIEKREFGIGTEKKIDSRHLAFANEQEIRLSLTRNTPLYVSHSIAYYQLPSAVPMEKKGWLGSDLVFDLDLETKRKYISGKEFEKIRADTLRLVEDFLIQDFGISENKIAINFSGSRGFHVHVRDERFFPLKSEERKEIIGYIKGIGLEYHSFFSQKEAGTISGRIVYRETGPMPNGAGYAGRFAKKILRILETNPQDLSRIFKDETKKQNFINCIKNGNWSLRKMSRGLDKKLYGIAENELAVHTVNIDSGVTQDITKLIRVPNSVHGSTGLCAKILSLSELARFEPMHHTIIFSEKPVRITASEDIPEIEIGNRTQEKISKGETKEVPEYFAIYLRLKESAIL